MFPLHDFLQNMTSHVSSWINSSSLFLSSEVLFLCTSLRFFRQKGNIVCHRATVWGCKVGIWCSGQDKHPPTLSALDVCEKHNGAPAEHNWDRIRSCLQTNPGRLSFCCVHYSLQVEIFFRLHMLQKRLTWNLPLLSIR